MDKLNFVKGITPLQKLNFHVGNTEIYMKRDDLIGFAGGGNKVRLFEYIAAEIKKCKAEKIVTFGSVHSNHVRVAAVVAAYLNIDCDLIILTDETSLKKQYTPNLRLVAYYPCVHVEYCPIEKAHDFIDVYLTKQKDAGINTYWIPGGGHLAIAVQGYVDAGREIVSQLDNLGVVAEAAFVPCGTGTTQAGLISSMYNRMSVYGITVARSVERCRKEIGSLIMDANSAKDIDMVNINSLIHILPNQIVYGKKDKQIDETIKALIESDGVFLDPVYNAKSFRQMINFLEEHTEIKTAVYVNTGGYQNLFAE